MIKSMLAFSIMLLVSFPQSKPHVMMIYPEAFRQNDSLIEQWRVDDVVANEMLDNYEHCRGNCHDDNTTATVAENGLIEKLIDALQNEGYDIETYTNVNARYTADGEKKYKKNRHYDDDNEKGKVKGYKTKLLKVTFKPASGSGNQAVHYRYLSAMYFDTYSICPPPTNCRNRS